MNLYETNPTLYNTAKRLGLGSAMELLKSQPNYEQRLCLLYQMRAKGLKVSVSGSLIVIDQMPFLPADLDSPDRVRKALQVRYVY